MKCEKLKALTTASSPKSKGTLMERRTRQLHQVLTAQLMYPQLHLKSPVLRRVVQTVGKAQKGQQTPRKGNFALVPVVCSRCNIFFDQMRAISAERAARREELEKEKDMRRCELSAFKNARSAARRQTSAHPRGPGVQAIKRCTLKKHVFMTVYFILNHNIPEQWQTEMLLKRCI
ncbi:hypothetical protein HPB51_019092 [Rhipicephalus microplus]|uniref:Uncharacterized protein n=1 Tax=Rhipicephalus microplus TaxID=6941 RepID=A0A9J6EHY8_RHIMP|nr:hypothetical protein HPB51_019092 [Rhipicephalus microplus]